MKLWTKNFTLIIVATTLGSIGGIAANFALSFLVFDETGSTFSAALVLAIEFIPCFLIPLVFSTWMDRLPRKPFLVIGDLVNGILYALMGIYLLRFQFSYIGYLGFSLLLSSVGAFDDLAYSSIYPNLIPENMKDKGYAFSSTLYPTLRVLMLPLAAVLFEAVGVAVILLIQSGLSVSAAIIESRIDVIEHTRMTRKDFSIKLWWKDIQDAYRFLRQEKGLRSIYAYLSFANGLHDGYSPLLVAYFRTTAGLTATMYSFFSVCFFFGRLLSGIVRYFRQVAPNKRFSLVFRIYLAYQAMDVALLWLPYPLMLVDRGAFGFLGNSSATLRRATVQKYIPDEYRARINAFESMLLTGTAGILSLIVGALGEIMDYRLCMTMMASITILLCFLLIYRNRGAVKTVYETCDIPPEQRMATI